MATRAISTPAARAMYLAAMDSNRYAERGVSRTRVTTKSPIFSWDFPVLLLLLVLLVVVVLVDVAAVAVLRRPDTSLTSIHSGLRSTPPRCSWWC